MSSIIEINAPPSPQLHRRKVRLSNTDRSDLAQTAAEPGVQKCLLQHFISNVLNVIDALRNILQRDYKPIDMQHVIFEWHMSHFQRRMQPDFSYIDSVLRKQDADKLGVSKLLTDLHNLRHHLRLIGEGHLDAAHESLLACHRLFHIRVELELELAENTEIANELAKKNFEADMFTLRANQAQNDLLHETMDRCIDESRVYLPIYFRYERNYHRVEFDGLEHSLLQREETLENESQQYYERIKTDAYVQSSVLDHHNGTIEVLQFVFRSELSYWSQKYETEFYELVDKGTLLQLRLKALEQNWKDCYDRIDFYRAEMIRLKEEELLQKQLKADQLAAEAEERVKAEELRKQERKKAKKNAKSQKK